MGTILLIVGLAILIGMYFQFYGVSFDPKSISGKRVLITGASSGIGEHLAYQYSKLGAKVFITARRENLLEKVAKKCKELGAEQVEFVPSDMGQSKDRDKVVAEVKKRFGGLLDQVIINHAVLSTGFWLGTKDNMTTFLNDLNVNFISFVDLASQLLPLLTESKGSIGVVSSVAGKVPIGGSSSYTTDKFALQGFFSALRQELQFRKTGVSVTTCIIGPVDTDIMKYSEEKKKELNENFLAIYLTETPEDTAVAIMTGVITREYEIYFGRIASVMVTLHKLFPTFIEEFFSGVYIMANF